MLHILRTSSCTSEHECCVCYFILFCAGERQDRISNYFASVRWLFFGGLWFTSRLCLHPGVAWWGARTARGWPGGGRAMARRRGASTSALSPGAGWRLRRQSVEFVGDSRGYFFFSLSRSGVISSARATAHFFLPSNKTGSMMVFQYAPMWNGSQKYFLRHI